MNLHRERRGYYVVDPAANPPLGPGTWEASFDGGETWIDGTLVPNGWAWLVAGPDFDAAAVGMDPDDTQATIETSMTPKLRFKDDPELEVPDSVPAIRLRS